MKFLKLSATQQIIAAGVVLGVLAIVLIVFLLVPQVVAVRSLSAQESKAIQDLESAKGNLTILEDAKRETRKTESRLIRLGRKAPPEAELPALIIQMEDISKKAGITEFLAIKPATPVQKDDYAEIPLEIKINGYFYETLDFLYRLERLPRIVTVQSVEIKEGKAKLPNIEATIKATTYISTPGVKAPAAAGGATPPGKAGTTGTSGGATR